MFSISSEALELIKVSEESGKAGAMVRFDGIVRNHNEGKAVDALEYEAYEALALKEGNRIVDEALKKFEVYKIHAVHRVGSLGIGDLAVIVRAWSAHRAQAFDACRYVIDEIKGRVPVWKLEHYTDGRRDWVFCPHCAHGGHDDSHEHNHDHDHSHHHHDHEHA